MMCRHSGQELSAYVDGELDTARRARVEEHLRHCADCRAAVEAMRRLQDTLAQAQPLRDTTRVRARVAYRLALAEAAPRFTCARVQQLLSARLDGDTTPAEDRLIQSHLDQCPACAAEAAAFATTAGILRALPEVEPPIALERCIRSAIAREQRSIFARWSLPNLLSPHLVPGLASATAAVILIAGFWMGRLFPGETPSLPRQTAVVTYQGSDAKTPATHWPARAAAAMQSTATVAKRFAREHTPASAPMQMKVADAAPRMGALAPSLPKEMGIVRSAPAPLARIPNLPVPQPLPESTQPVAPAPASAPVNTPAPPDTTTAARELAPRPAVRVAMGDKIEAEAPVSSAVESRHAEEWEKAQEDLRKTFALLNGESPDRAVRKEILRVSWR